MVETPKAWILAQFTGQGTREPIFRTLTAAHKTFWGLQEDPVAHELYRTILETKPDASGAYTSLHHMIIEGSNQVFHFHPPHPEDPFTSRRWVYLAALPPEGAQFRWFDLKDAIISSGDKESEVTGIPADKIYEIKVPAWTSAIISLDAGAHVFSGNCLAVSLHPKDIKRQLHHDNTLVGNTALYRGALPQTVTQVKVDTINQFAPRRIGDRNITTLGITDKADMQTVYLKHMEILRDTTLRGVAEQPSIEDLVGFLRIATSLGRAGALGK